MKLWNLVEEKDRKEKDDLKRVMTATCEAVSKIAESLMVIIQQQHFFGSGRQLANISNVNASTIAGQLANVSNVNSAIASGTLQQQISADPTQEQYVSSVSSVEDTRPRNERKRKKRAFS